MTGPRPDRRVGKQKDKARIRASRCVLKHGQRLVRATQTERVAPVLRGYSAG